MKTLLAILLLCIIGYAIVDAAEPKSKQDTFVEINVNSKIFLYDETSLEIHNGKITTLVLSTEPSFNYKNHPDYTGFLGKFVVRCSPLSVGYALGMTFDKHNHVIEQDAFPDARHTYVDVPKPSIFNYLARVYCTSA
jgi:hypothetical protein